MPDPAPPTEKTKPTKLWEDRVLTGVVAGFLGVIAVLGVVLIWRILNADTSLTAHVIGSSGGAPSAAAVDTSTLIQSNERLLQLVQWTIGLVITIGALLIGFSWFQSRSRYEEDRQRLADMKEDLKESSRLAREDALAARQELAEQKIAFDAQSESFTKTLGAQQAQSMQLSGVLEEQLASIRNIQKEIIRLFANTANLIMEDAVEKYESQRTPFAVDIVAYALEEFIARAKEYGLPSSSPILPLVQAAKAFEKLLGLGAKASMTTRSRFVNLKTDVGQIWGVGSFPSQFELVFRNWETVIDILIATTLDDLESQNDGSTPEPTSNP